MRHAAADSPRIDGTAHSTDAFAPAGTLPTTSSGPLRSGQSARAISAMCRHDRMRSNDTFEWPGNRDVQLARNSVSFTTAFGTPTSTRHVTITRQTWPERDCWCECVPVLSRAMPPSRLHAGACPPEAVSIRIRSPASSTAPLTKRWYSHLPEARSMCMEFRPPGGVPGADQTGILARV